MAGTSLLALLDDITSVLDDVALLTKVAAKKTSGVLGDDLALNAEQVSGVIANREIPVVLAVAKGSAINKLILVPLALLFSFFLPQVISFFLILGGLYLTFEGCEKVLHFLFSSKTEKKQREDTPLEHLKLSLEELVVFEKEKIKGAIKTDFVLSAEIITITLASVAQSHFLVQLSVLIGISVLMTIGVYGLVGLIVKIDDFGFYLIKKNNFLLMKMGVSLIQVTPFFMKLLSFAGTLAMFLVGGGILVHNVPYIHHLTSNMSLSADSNLHSFLVLVMDGSIGLMAGLMSTLLFKFFKNMINLLRKVFKK